MSRWLAVWTRAVIVPAVRRASAVWLGTAIVAGVIFGPTAMHPRDLTQLALHAPGVGAVLAATWLLLYVPTARLLLRAEGATFLHSLPAPRLAPRVIVGVALIALQLPWLALWLAGDGARGLAIVLAWTCLIVLVAVWRPAARPTRWPRWRRDTAALRGVYVRALRRRASDALVRGLGLAILAGLAAGLFVRNNQLAGVDAAVLGSGAIAVVLVPGWVGVLLPLVEAHRASAWLAASLGISPIGRIGVLATVVAAIYVAGAAVAVAAASAMFGADLIEPAATIAWLAVVALAVALGAGLLATRAVVWADRDPIDTPKDALGRGEASARLVVGAVAASLASVIFLGWLGVEGAPGVVALGIAAVLTARPA